ncbi:MAG: VWA domain-containing protein [Acidobacteria bacterium]|nr:VWA domain-containing protein [Acidobacteriota bacterium]
MNRRIHVCLALVAVLCMVGYLVAVKASKNRLPGFTATASTVTQGSLQVLSGEGNLAAQCPLKHTNVKAEISGFLSRVMVTQEFENPFKDKIEAVYTFPLPHNAAVDDLTMTVGERIIRGSIKRRAEARAVYEAARNAGHVASLLDQERANIFTQSVANIMPGEKVVITISYVETLKYDNGAYEFVFPMVVGPRYIPGEAIGKQGGGFAPDTTQVADASRITPKPVPPGTRAGHDISIEVALDAGVPIDNLKSTLHEIETEKLTPHSSMIKLKSRNEIPNKDFILRYDVAGGKIEDALLTHHGKNGGFFSFILQPPDRVAAEDVTPKEIVFVLDTSGSMDGFPIEKAKESMKLALAGLYPQDTFNLITFAGDTHILFPEPVAATQENLRKAQQFLASRSGGGGTEMMKAIRAALEPTDKQDHLRIVCFMTDGYVGNDQEIIAEIQKHPKARVFSFGIGSSVNRFLLDKMAEHGRGEVEYVTLQDDGSAAAKRFHERIRNPLLTDISVDWNGLPVADVYPKRIPDLFDAKPVVLTGRFTGSGKGVIRVKGKLAGRDYEKEIAVDLPEAEPRREVLAKLWARTRIEDLMAQDYRGAQYGDMKTDLQETVTQIGLEYRLMTQFTSFVAVEEMTVTDGGQPRRLEVPVEMPEGVSYDGVFGKDEEKAKGNFYANAQGVINSPASPTSARKASESVTVTAEPRRKTDTGKSSGIGTGSGTGMGSGRGGAGRDNKAVEVDKPNDATSSKNAEQRALRAKLHPTIAATLDRLKNKTQPLAGEAKFVRHNKAEVQLWLTDKSPATLAQLKKLGFEVLLDAKNPKLLIGRIALEQLEELAKQNFVTYLSPVTSN